MGRGLQINQVGDAFQTAPGVVVNALDFQPSGTQTIDSPTFVDITGSSSTFIAPLEGDYLVTVRAMGPGSDPSSSPSNMFLQVVLDSGESHEYSTLDDNSWRIYMGDSIRANFGQSFSVHLSAGEHAIKLRARRTSVADVTIDTVCDFKVQAQLVGGSGTGGVLSTYDVYTPSYTGGSGLQTIMSKTVSVAQGDTLFASANFTINAGSVGTISYQLYIDGTIVHGANEGIPVTGPTGRHHLFLQGHASDMDAGEVDVEVKVDSGATLTFETDDVLRTWLFRGGYFPIQRDGTDQVVAPVALNVIEPLIVVPSGNTAVLSVPPPTFSGLYDAPSQYEGYADYFVKVKTDESGVEFVVPSGGGGGTTDFTGLTDTPSSYTGSEYYLARVNAAGDALEFVAPSGLNANGVLVDSVELADDVTVSDTYPTFADVTGLSIATDTVDGEYVLITLQAEANSATATDAHVMFTVDGTDISSERLMILSDTLQYGSNISMSRWVGPLAAGSHTFKVRAARGASSSFNVKEAAVLQVSRYRGGYSDVTVSGLVDTPDSYAGAGHYLLRVKDTLDGVEFVAPSGTAGTIEFTGLTDTPALYSGSEHYSVRVNQAGDALEFVAPSGVTGGTVIERYTGNAGLLDSSTYNEITDDTELTLHDHDFDAFDGEQVLFKYLQTARRQLTGTTTPRLAVYIDDVKVHDIHNQIGTQWEYVRLDFEYFTDALSAGTHNIKVTLRSYDTGNSDVNYGASKLDLVRYRGGYHAVTVSGLVDTPDSYAGAGHYLLRVKDTLDGVEFVAPSGTPGTTEFTGLTDTPSVYTGLAHQIVRVKEDETGLEIVPSSGVQGATALEQTGPSGVETVVATNNADVITDSIYVNGPEDVVLITFAGFGKKSTSSTNDAGYLRLRVDSGTDDAVIFEKPNISGNTSRHNLGFARQITGLSAGAHSFTVNWYSTVGTWEITGYNLDLSISRGGIQAFTNGADTPETYAGAGHHILRVKDTLDGVEFVAPSGAAGASAFTDLTDTPSLYSGDEFKLVRVNSDGDGLEFVAPSGSQNGGLGVQATELSSDPEVTTGYIDPTQSWQTLSELTQTVAVADGEYINVQFIGRGHSNHVSNPTWMYLTLLLDGVAQGHSSDAGIVIGGYSEDNGSYRNLSFSRSVGPLAAGEYTIAIGAAKYQSGSQSWVMNIGRMETHVYRGDNVPVTVSGLADTPNTYDSAANYMLRVNAAEDGVEFVAPSGYLLSSLAENLPVFERDGSDTSLINATAPQPTLNSIMRVVLNDGNAYAAGGTLTCDLDTTGVGGRDASESVAVGHWHIFGVDDGSGGLGLVASKAADPNTGGPTNHSIYKYLWTILVTATGGTTIEEFTQKGDWYIPHSVTGLWNTMYIEWDSTNLPTQNTWYDLNSETNGIDNAIGDVVPLGVADMVRWHLWQDYDGSASGSQLLRLHMKPGNATTSATSASTMRNSAQVSTNQGGQASNTFDMAIDSTAHWAVAGSTLRSDAVVQVWIYAEGYRNSLYQPTPLVSTIDTFTGLADTLASYSGNAGKVLTINQDEDAVIASGMRFLAEDEFTADSPDGNNRQTFALTYTPRQTPYTPSGREIIGVLRNGNKQKFSTTAPGSREYDMPTASGVRVGGLDLDDDIEVIYGV